MSQRRNDKNRSASRKAARASGEASAQSETISRRAQRRIDEERDRKRQRFLMIGGAVVVALIIVGALITFNRSDDGDGASDLAITVPEARDASVPQDGRTLGSPDAPVTIIEYADFQCPFCGDWAKTIEPRLVQDYISTGQVRLEFHAFPFLDDRADGSESDNATEAALCAQDQGQFWAYHDLLFNNQSGENEGAFSRDRLIEMARNVNGLDVDQFTSCIDGDEHEDEVQALYQGAIDAGVNSTPTFDVNGTKVTGINYPQLQQAIEAALAS
ncbi:MAG TPA: DsbA family protein [Thermomicrobiales bacterium]|nr:DsbA family protein [Thermomicrobiales bacterium]